MCCILFSIVHVSIRASSVVSYVYHNWATLSHINPSPPSPPSPLSRSSDNSPYTSDVEEESLCCCPSISDVLTTCSRCCTTYICCCCRHSEQKTDKFAKVNYRCATFQLFLQLFIPTYESLTSKFNVWLWWLHKMIYSGTSEQGVLWDHWFCPL